MAVTEIAHLTIKVHSDDQNSFGIPPEALRNLQHAMSEQAAYSGYPVALLQSQDDPSQLFLLGGWKSTSHHMNEWLPGPINQGLLELLSGEIDVKWMFHLDTDPFSFLDLIRGSGNLEDPQIIVGLYFVGNAQRSDCEAVLRDGLGSGLDGFEGVRGAWRLDLGYVTDGSELVMRVVENTVVVLTVHGGNGKSSQASILLPLEDNAREKTVRSVKVISFIDKNEKVDMQSVW